MNDLALQEHLTPDELAPIWKKDPKTIRQWFENEPGVLIDDHPETRNKRGYRTFSIPISIVRKVHARKSPR